MKLIKKGRWSPTPNSIGSAHEFLIQKSGVAHTVSMGREPRKCVAVSSTPVVAEIVSHKSKPSSQIKAFPKWLR